MAVAMLCRGFCSARASAYLNAVLRACAMKRTDIEFIQADGFAGTFERGETVTGGTSGATGQFVGKGKDGIIVEGVVGTFSLGEVLTGATSAASANATDDPISGHQYMPTSVHADKPSVTAIRYQDGHKFSLRGLFFHFLYRALV